MADTGALSRTPSRLALTRGGKREVYCERPWRRLALSTRCYFGAAATHKSLVKDEKTAASVKLPLRSPLRFGSGLGSGLGVRRYGDRGWCGAPKHVDPMARHVHDMTARRRDGRTARPLHHALLVSARGWCGVIPPPEAAPGWSMVKVGGGSGSSTRGGGWAPSGPACPPGNGSPP